jgi:hypothetical protein
MGRGENPQWRPNMSGWKNIGDINPKSGTLLIRGGELDHNGDFSIEMVDVTPESDIGGDDSRFMLRSGTGFLVARDFQSALEMIDAAIDPESLQISMPGHHGDTIVNEAGSEDWITTMALATHAFGGIDNIDIQTLVQIGKDEAYSRDRKFKGDIYVYYTGSNLWAIMRDTLDGFDFDDGSKGGARFNCMIEDDVAPLPW